MVLNEDVSGQLDEKGRLVFSPGLSSSHGLKPGDDIHIDEDASGFQLHPPTRLDKLYIEPTNQCNLDCRTCIRNVWDEPLGMMTDAVFERILEGVRTLPIPPLVFFGGFGEPLSHPKIVEMVARTKALGASTELITNGTLLNAKLSRELIAAGLNMLWVSLDGATPESYADIRLGASLPTVLDNLTRFQMYSTSGSMGYCSSLSNHQTRLGIEFVAMKRNIAELPAVLNLGRQIGAERFIMTNVLPYTNEMRNEVLYDRTIGDSCYSHLSLAGIDLNELTRGPLRSSIRNGLEMTSENTGLAEKRCPFIASGAGAIRWDGCLSPCLPLLHSYICYLDGWESSPRCWSIGNVTEHHLADLWNKPEHIAFRERVQRFDFSPCTQCGGCKLMEKNEEDCFGNTFPTCGSCLWAQGLIQCP